MVMDRAKEEAPHPLQAQTGIKAHVLISLGFNFTTKLLPIRSVPTATTPAPAPAASVAKNFKEHYGEESSKNLKKEVKHSQTQQLPSPESFPPRLQRSASQSSTTKRRGTSSLKPRGRIELSAATAPPHSGFGKETGSLRSWTERQKRLHTSLKLRPRKVNDLKGLDFNLTMKHLSTRSLSCAKGRSHPSNKKRPNLAVSLPELLPLKRSRIATRVSPSRSGGTRSART